MPALHLSLKERVFFWTWSSNLETFFSLEFFFWGGRLPKTWSRWIFFGNPEESAAEVTGWPSKAPRTKRGSSNWRRCTSSRPAWIKTPSFQLAPCVGEPGVGWGSKRPFYKIKTFSISSILDNLDNSFHFCFFFSLPHFWRTSAATPTIHQRPGFTRSCSDSKTADILTTWLAPTETAATEWPQLFVFCA